MLTLIYLLSYACWTYIIETLVQLHYLPEIMSRSSLCQSLHILAYYAVRYVAFRAGCIFADFFLPTNQTRLHVSLTATPFVKDQHNCNCHGTGCTVLVAIFVQKKQCTLSTRQKNSTYSEHTKLYFSFVAKPRARVLNKMAVARYSARSCHSYFLLYRFFSYI